MSSFFKAMLVFHVAISLAGIASGFVVAYGLLRSRRFDRWIAFFLATTVATSVTGFLLPFQRFMPSHAVGIVSLIILPIAIFAWYFRGLAGFWRPTFTIAAMFAQYLNVFVLVAQAFLKVPPLKALAPTGSEPAFLIAQLIVLLLFVGLTAMATRRFRPGRATGGEPSPQFA